MTEIQIVTSVDTGQVEGANRTFKSTKQEIKALKDELLNLDEGSKEYAQTLVKVANLTNDIRETNERVAASAADFGQILGNVTRVAAGVAGGFNALQGVMALTGAKSEDLQKMMVKLQAGMSIVQGLTALESGFKSLKNVLPLVTTGIRAVNAAMAANPIGTVVVAVTALVGVFALLTRESGKTTKQLDDLNKVFDKLESRITNFTNKQLKDLEDYYAFNEDKARAAGATEEELLELRMANGNAYQKILRSNIETQKEWGNELDKFAGQAEDYTTNWRKTFNNSATLKEALDSRAAFVGELDKIDAKFRDEDIEGWRKFHSENVDLLKKNDSAIVEAYKPIIKSMQEANVEVLSTLEQRNEKSLEEEDRYYDELEVLKIRREREVGEAAYKERTVLEQKERDQAKEIAKEAYYNAMEAENEEIQRLTDKYDKESTLLYNNGISTIELERVFNAERKAIEDKYAQERLDKQKEAIDKEHDLLVENYQFKLQMIGNEAEMRAAASEAEFAQMEIDAQRRTTFGQQLGEGETTQSIADKRLAELQAQYDIEYIFAQQEMKLYREIANNEKLSLQERSDAQVKYTQKQTQLTGMRKNLATAEVNVQKAKFDTINTALTAASDIAGENTVAAKGIAVAQATISTYLNAQQAFTAMTATGAGPWAIAAGAAAFAAALASGFANIKSILAVNPKGESGSTGGPTTPQMPAFVNSGVPIQETHNIQTADELDIVNKPIKVYVVESDIAAAQNKVEVVEKETSF